MNINEEIEVKQRKVGLLKLEIEEIKLRDEWATYQKNTHIIDENGCVKSQALLEKQGREILCLRDMYGALWCRVYDREAEISRLEKSNCEFHETIVKLHTEIQDKDGRINELETKLGQLSPVMIEIAEVVSVWLASDKQPIGNLETLTKIAAVIDEHNRFLEEKYSGSAVPASVAATVTKMEDVLNDGLPDGMEVKVLAHPVTPKQMSDMINIAKEN